MDAKPTDEMVKFCTLFKDYLAQAIGKSLELTMPDRLYVRSTGVHFATQQPVSLANIGKPAPKGTVGYFWYPNDVRGLEKSLKMPGISKPGIPLYTQAGGSLNTENLRGASAGIGLPTTFGATRIQEYSALLAQAIGEQVANESARPLSPVTIGKYTILPPQASPTLQKEQAILNLAEKSVGQ